MGYSFTEEVGNLLVEGCLDAVESLFLLLVCSDAQTNTLRSVLRCVISLCHVQKQLCPRFVQLIATCLVDDSAGRQSITILWTHNIRRMDEMY